MKPEEDKTMITVAHVTGFMTKDRERRFIIDQNSQLNLSTMTWFAKDDLGNGLRYKSIRPAFGRSCLDHP